MWATPTATKRLHGNQPAESVGIVLESSVALPATTLPRVAFPRDHSVRLSTNEANSTITAVQLDVTLKLVVTFIYGGLHIFENDRSRHRAERGQDLQNVSNLIWAEVRCGPGRV